MQQQCHDPFIVLGTEVLAHGPRVAPQRTWPQLEVEGEDVSCDALRRMYGARRHGSERQLTVRYADRQHTQCTMNHIDLRACKAQYSAVS